MRIAESVRTTSALGNDTYIYHIVCGDGWLASISSDDSLRLTDQQTLRIVPLPEHTFSHIHDGVTCLKVRHDRGILTAGRDAVVKCTDLRTKKTALTLSKEIKSPILSLACQGSFIAAGTELTNSQASIILWDSRDTRQPLLEYTESHNDDVTDLSFHTSNPSVLLSGSTDGLVNLYDSRITDEDDALVQVFNHGSSIAHAGFLSDHEVYALSHDETFSIYGTNQLGQHNADESSHLFGDLRPQLRCQYVIDLVSSASTGPVFGAGPHSGQYLDLVPLRKSSSWSLDPQNTLRLLGGHGEEIVRSMCFSDDSSTIFTGGEDGLVKVWTVPEEARSTTQTVQHVPNVNKKRKNSKGIGKDERARFNPY